MIKQIGLPLRGRPILLITRMITDRIGLHSVLLPLPIDDHDYDYDFDYI